MASELTNGVGDTIRKNIPGFKLGYKNESLLMRLLGVLTYPFNQAFMDGFITTIGTTVYFPSREHLTSRGDAAAEVLAHEFVHMWDSNRQWFRYNIGYLSPQIFFIPLLVAYSIVGSWMPVAAVTAGLVVSYLALWVTMKATNDDDKGRDTRERYRAIRLIVFYAFMVVVLAGYVAMSIWLSSWWAFLAVGAFAPLAPWPSPWRAKWEYRGYAMSISWPIWKDGEISDRRMKGIASQFTGMNYFRMDPNEKRVMGKLNSAMLSAKDGEIIVGEGSEPYRMINYYLASEGRLSAVK